MLNLRQRNPHHCLNVVRKLIEPFDLRALSVNDNKFFSIMTLKPKVHRRFLRWTVAILLAFAGLVHAQSAQAAVPVITAPAVTTAAQGTAKTVAGISIAETGAQPTLSYTVKLASGAGTLTATGAAVSGSGTTSLTITGTSPVVNAALATLAFTGSASDQIAITATDATSQNAVPVMIGVQVLPSSYTYLIFPTQTLALARSQSQCAALGCDGVKTVYWWNVIGPTNAGTIGSTTVTTGSYAVEIQGSGPFAPTTKVGPCAVGCGLTSTEQGQLFTAAQVATVLP